jgi:hypothetical protein
VAHAPITHGSGPHETPHAPQCWAFEVVSAQTLPQVASPVGQGVQRPITQAAESPRAAAQARPQTPQWLVEFDVAVSQPFAVSPSQSPKPGAHTTRHAPETQTGAAFAPAVHATPQAPQLDGSFETSTQRSSHARCPAAHGPLAGGQAERSTPANAKTPMRRDMGAHQTRAAG